MADAVSPFSSRLKAAMDARGVTVPGLVARCGAFSERSISRWRNDRVAPYLDAIPRLADALDVPAAWLLGEGPDDVPSSKESRW